MGTTADNAPTIAKNASKERLISCLLRQQLLRLPAWIVNLLHPQIA